MDHNHHLPAAQHTAPHDSQSSSASSSRLPDAATSSPVASTSRKITITKRPNDPLRSLASTASSVAGQADSSNHSIANTPSQTGAPSPAAFSVTSASDGQGDVSFTSDYPMAASPRTGSLKPKKPSLLSAVLPKLITALIRRDAYAFFTQPVDEREVPGYSTVIQQPMDLGTIKGKVDQARYTTIGQFRDDFNLVTSNAKRFNPPDSIFHQQAVKLEVWGNRALDKEEEKGVVLHLEESSSSGAEDSPAASTPKKLSIRLKRPPSEAQGQPSPTSKRPRPSQSDKERSVSRPAISSALRQPPTLADSPSPASDSEDAVGGSSRASIAREGTDRGYTGSTGTQVKIEAEDYIGGLQGRDDEEQGDGRDEEDEEDEEDDNADRSTRRGGSASLAPSGRDSATPVPGGASRRRPVIPARRLIPRKNAPPRYEETAVAAIHRVVKEAATAGIEMDAHEAALYARQATRDQASEKTLAYYPTGSIDVDTMRYNERVDLCRSRGLLFDASSNAPHAGAVFPELSSVHPIHPDAQQYSAQLARAAPRDALFAASASQTGTVQDRASLHEHAFPPGHTHMPTTVPTAPILTTKHEGLLSRGAALLPNRWPNPQQPEAKDYKVPDSLDERALPSARVDPSTLQLKTFGGGPTTQKSRNKDAEREAEGVSNLPDWTYPHTYYNRLWDGLRDLAAWKDVESTIMRFGPNGGIRGSDGELSSFDLWEETKHRRMKEMIKWEEREAICRAAGSSASDADIFPPLIDDDTEMGVLSKISAMTNEERALPNTEKARQHLESLDFYRMILWGSKPDGIVSTSGVNGDAWARSVEAFVKGATDGVQDPGTEETAVVEPQLASDPAVNDHTMTDLQSQEFIKASVHDGPIKDERGRSENDPSSDLFRSASPPHAAGASAEAIALTLKERLVEAFTLGTILEGSLYDHVRDNVVVPASAQGGLSVAIKAGVWMKGLHDRSRATTQDKEGKTSPSDDDLVESETDMLDDVLSADDPLWAEVARLVGTDATPAPASASAPLPSPASLPLSSPLSLSTLTAHNFAYLLVATPRLWGRSHFMRILLDKPMLLDHLVLRTMDEWTEVARGRASSAKTSLSGTLAQAGAGAEGEGEKSPADVVVRYGDAEWTRARLAGALDQYARLLLWLDQGKGQSRHRRRTGGQKGSANGSANGSADGKDQVQKEKQEEMHAATSLARMEEEVRLALLSIARMAPGYHVKMLVK